MTAHDTKSFTPLTETEVQHCIAAGVQFPRLHLHEDSELHLYRLPQASTRLLDGVSFFLAGLGLFAVGSTLLVSGLEDLLVFGGGGLFCIGVAWAVFAESRACWTLRLGARGFVHERSGPFPYSARVIRGAPETVTAIWQMGARGPGVHLFAKLGGHKVELAHLLKKEAEQLVDCWERHRSGPVEPASQPTPRPGRSAPTKAAESPSKVARSSDRLPPPPRWIRPASEGRLHVDHALQLANLCVFRGHIELTMAEPQIPVLVHLLPNPLHEFEADPHVAHRLWLATAAELPHVQPALAMVVLDAPPYWIRQVAILAPQTKGLDLGQICQRHGALPTSVALEVATRLAQTIATAAAIPGGRPAYPAHGQLESSMVLLDSEASLTVLQYAFRPAPQIRGEQIVMGDVPRVLSPEHIRGDGPTDDRYALGLILLELLQGSPPHAELSSLELMKRSLASSSQAGLVAHAIKALDSPPTPAVADLLRQLLAFHPDDRPERSSLPDRLRALVADGSGPSIAEWAGQVDLGVEIHTPPDICGKAIPFRLLAHPDDIHRSADAPPTLAPT